MNTGDIKLDELSGEKLIKSLQENYWETVGRLTILAIPQFTISEIGITHRWITHWDKQGLLGTRRNGSGWRRFSFVDYIWLRIIVQLRKFNLPLSSIKSVKKFLWEPTPKREEYEKAGEEFLHMAERGEYPLPPGVTIEEFRKGIKYIFTQQKSVFRYLTRLFWTIVLMQSYEGPICLLIDQNGVCGSLFLADKESTEASLGILGAQIPQKDFICLNLYRILQEFYSNEKIKNEVVQSIALLSPKEKQILELIQKGDFKELSIKLNGNNDYYVGIKRDKPLEQITHEVKSIISRNKYQDITLKTVKGKIVFAEVTEKIKI